MRAPRTIGKQISDHCKRSFSSFSGRFTVGTSQSEKLFPKKGNLAKEMSDVDPGNLWKLAKKGEVIGQKLDKEGYENIKRRTAERVVTGGISDNLVEAQIKLAMEQDSCADLPFA